MTSNPEPRCPVECMRILRYRTERREIANEGGKREFRRTDRTICWADEDTRRHHHWRSHYSSNHTWNNIYYDTSCALLKITGPKGSDLVTFFRAPSHCPFQCRDSSTAMDTTVMTSVCLVSCCYTSSEVRKRGKRAHVHSLTLVTLYGMNVMFWQPPTPEMSRFSGN